MKNNLNLLRRSLFLISMPMVFITFALPLRAEDIGATGFEIGILYSIFAASLIVLRPLVGAGAALGPLAGGAIYDGLGTDYIFYVAGIILVSAIAIAQLYNKKL